MVGPGGDTRGQGDSGTVADLDRWWARVNLGVVLRHYERLDALLEAEEASGDVREAAFASDSRALNAGHAVLYVCSNLEEILWFLWETVFRIRGVPGRGGLDRFKPALGDKGLGLDLGRAVWWEPLQDAFTLRDCLLHGNGRLALLTPKKRAAMDRILERVGDGLSVEHDRVRVQHQYVMETLRAAVAMIDAIHVARESRGI